MILKKKIFLIVNKRKVYGLSLNEGIKYLKKRWYNSSFLNIFRRSLDFNMAKCKHYLGLSSNNIRLHLGCGNRRLDDHINIDLRKTEATDLVCNIKKLPYSNGSARLIETYHVIEHLPRHDLPKALKEWFRILAPKGKLIIECPDFDKTVKEYIKGDEKRIDNIFGLQRFAGDTHMFGYNFKRLRKF